MRHVKTYNVLPWFAAKAKNLRRGVTEINNSSKMLSIYWDGRKKSGGPKKKRKTSISSYPAGARTVALPANRHLRWPGSPVARRPPLEKPSTHTGFASENASWVRLDTSLIKFVSIEFADKCAYFLTHSWHLSKYWHR
jgi:hypothetical protein